MLAVGSDGALGPDVHLRISPKQQAILDSCLDRAPGCSHPVCPSEIRGAADPTQPPTPEQRRWDRAVSGVDTYMNRGRVRVRAGGARRENSRPAATAMAAAYIRLVVSGPR
jgi:hypothetical protein